MNVIIGSARCDENKKYSGGKKGDQTQTAIDDYKGEVSMQSFYVHKKGWVILRPKYDDVAIRLAQSMKNACNNKNIGYSQSDRYSLLYESTSTNKLVNCDCSSLVRQCIKEATGKDTGDFNTSNEVNKILATNSFTKIDFTSAENLYDGDILVTKTKGHTVIVVSAKPRVEKHIQLNYVKGHYYTIITTALNVRKAPVTGTILSTLKKGDNIICKGTKRVGDAIWMYLGKDNNEREQWCCADNGTRQYIGE
jgi:hypothetical protein